MYIYVYRCVVAYSVFLILTIPVLRKVEFASAFPSFNGRIPIYDIDKINSLYFA